MFLVFAYLYDICDNLIMKQKVTLFHIRELLTRLGLTKHGAKIYLALLSEGESSVASLARNIGIERVLIYRTLPSLIDLGLIAKVPCGKRTNFIALPPVRIEELWADTERAMKSAIPELSALFKNHESRPNVLVLKGKIGIASVYEDILSTLPRGGVFYRYSSAKNPRARGDYVPREYNARRDAKQIERFVITNKLSATRKSPRLERAVKIIPQGSDLFAYNITQLIYGSKIAFVDYNTETAIIIENSLIAAFQERLFKLLYQRL